MQKQNDLKLSMILFFLLFFPLLIIPCRRSSANQVKWFQGYLKSIKGGTIDYHSPQPDVQTALLVRSLHSEDYIEWQTEAIPPDFREDFATFIWIFGMDVDSNPHNYDLFVNGDKWFRFSNPRVSTQKEWSIEGPNKAELLFRVTLVDRHDDVFGYASMRISSSALDKGKPLTIKVVGETAGSRVWYMTFQSSVKPGVEIVPQQALLRHGNQLVQPVSVHVIHLGEPAKARIFPVGQEAIQTELKFGFNRIDLAFPEVSSDKEHTVIIQTSQQEPIKKKVILKPIRKWIVYLVQHTHTDIGYTRPQTEILPEHLRFIDYALDYCDLTENYPDDAKFRWTCEASWAVNQYLESRPPGQIERLKKRVKEGRIEVTGMIFNMSEIADENIYAASLNPVKKFKNLGLNVTTAMQNDVNGIAWCMADFFPDTGIEYLIMGQHGHRALIPFDKPTAFWWESPSGRRLLAFRADHYMTGNFWGIHTRKFQTLERELMRYLESLESREYPFERIAVQYSGYFTDNAPPSTIGSDMIKLWNEKYEWPKLRSATAREFPAYIKECFGEHIPVHRVAWPDWWSDGFGSAALETATARETQAHLISNQGLLSLAKLLGMSIPSSTLERMNEIYDALLFWDEHTLGAAESISQPLVENSVVQWAEKSAYVWEAVKDSRILQESAMGLVQPHIPREEVPTIAVFNTLNWPRSGIAEVYVDHEILPSGKAFRLVDEKGREAFAQISRSRADGTYWYLRVENIPPLGYKVYHLELLDKPHKSAREIKTQEAVLENDFYRMAIDPKRGSVSSLFDKQLGVELQDKQSPWLLGQFIHETISNRSQLEQFHLVSCQRQSLDRVSIQKILDGPLWKSILMTGETSTAAENTPLQIEIRLHHNEKRIEFHYALIKKDITAPEAIYIAFPFKLPQAQVSYEAHGGTVSPGMNQLEGTSSDWHAVQNFIALRSPKGQIVLVSDEIPLVQFGDLNLGKFQYIAQVEKPHIFSWVMNNYWVTNFRASQEGEFKWNYFLTSSEDISNTFATRYGWNSRIPFVCRVFPPGKASKIPKEHSTLLIDADNILLVSAKPSSDGKGIILHLRETEGKTTEFSISLPAVRSQNRVITEVNVLEETIGQPTKTLKIEPWESKFYKIEF